jgi:5-methylcytosine-specific restriction protein B
MAKYDPLTDRLNGEASGSLTLDFHELDTLVDGLPPTARQHRAWWANDTTSTSRHSQSWMDAGWRVDRVDLSAERVTFARGDASVSVSGAGQRTIPGTRRTFGDAIEYEMADAPAYNYNDRSGLYHVTGCGHGTELMRSVPRDEVIAAWHDTPDVLAADRPDQQWCSTCLAVRVKTEGDSDGVRRDLLIRAMFDVVGAADRPLKNREVMERVREAVQLNPVELSMNNSGQERFNTFIGFASGWATKVGWIDKHRDGWTLTETGVAEVATLSDEELYRELTKRYRVALQAEKDAAAVQADPRYAVLVDALSLVEAGQWTTYTDLGELAGLQPARVGEFVTKTHHPSGHRVIQVSGKPYETYPFLEDGLAPRDALEEEGIEFNDSGVADEQRKVTVEDLRERLDEMGLMPKVPRRAWLVRGSSVNGKDLVPTWLSEGWASLPATNLRRVEPGITRDELKPIIDEDYAHASYAEKANKLDELHAFLSRMQPDHLVATVSQGRLHLGRIIGAATFEEVPNGDSNLRRAVQWAGGQEGIDYSDFPGDLAARLKVQRDVLDLTQQLETLEGLLVAEQEDAPPPVIEEVVLRDATVELAEKLHVPQEWLQECIDLLNDRPQLIFYGPPGTGKTYIAQDLAKHVAGDNVRLVQFHPSYSYEDFFEGFRPTPDGGFALKPGPMRRIVDQAVANPTVPHVLIIDEINRGNLAKVFGELYFLLEYRNSNVELLYADDDFSLPPNVYVIGTMNTADRSIALVDAAMRRRFAFLPLHPSEKPTSEVLRSWLKSGGRPTRVADLLEELNARIADPDFKIGPSYFMRDAVYEGDGLGRTWRTSILPLLEEHHYGELSGAEVAARYGLPAIASRVDRVVEVAVDEEVDDASSDAD